jgi:hypothetical protein
MHSVEKPLGAVVVALLLSAPAAAIAQNGSASSRQFQFSVDTLYSLAWYQVNPHISVLWATTCPQDPHWRPGESRNTGWDLRGLPTPKVGMALINDSVIPWYERDAARPICTPHAVFGDVSADDTLTWHGLHGTIRVDPTKLVSGLPLRDRTALRDIFQPHRWPYITFVIDSVSNVTPADTVRGLLYGRWFFRDVELPTASPFTAWHETPGLRVRARLSMAPLDLHEVYGVSIVNIRLGLMRGVWERIHYGVDVILKPAPAGSTSAGN